MTVDQHINQTHEQIILHKLCIMQRDINILHAVLLQD